MAEQSSTPLVKKLGIKADHTVLLLDEPEGFRALLLDLPANAALITDAQDADVIVFFIGKVARLKRFPALVKKLRAGGGLWIAYPKKASGVTTDVTFERVQAAGLATGLVDNKICAVDATWTALRFVYRKT